MIQPNMLVNRAESYLHTLCVEIDNRRVGSSGNRAATDFFARQMAGWGYTVETPAFDCMDWQTDGASLAVDGAPFAVQPSPYSLGCAVQAPLAVVTTVAELEAADLAGTVALLRGAIAAGQLMPKNFPFYNPDEHRHIIALLEAKQPQAIVAATGRDPGLAGSLYPFPLIEDGDFDIPSVYMTDVEGERLAAYAGQTVTLTSRARRLPATGCNVIARKGEGLPGKLVCCAHIDAKLGTPGALDNAAGVSVLLLLGELLVEYTGELGIGLVAINGEDYYSNPGEQHYLAANAGQFDRIVLGVNIDGVGYHKGRVAYSLYECPTEIAQAAHAVCAEHEAITQGEAWFQGDHFLFVMHGRPALALTLAEAAVLMAEVIHTPADNPVIVDPAKLTSTALALRDLVVRLAPGMARS